MTHLRAAAFMAWCLVFPVGAGAQEPTVLSALGLEPVVWDRWETRVADKRAWLTRAGVPCDSARSLDDFHSLDVDADGRADIVYSGPCPSPADCLEVRVYRNAETRFVRAFSTNGSIAALVRPAPQQALHIVYWPWASPECAGPGLYPAVLAFLRPSARPDTALFRREDVTYYSGTQWPREPLPSALRVRVTQNQYNLRWAPAADDTTRGESCEWAWRGNVLATFGRGATAVALAELRDGTRTWYFVITDSASAFTSAHPDLRGGTRLLGWMSARYLETIPFDPPAGSSAAPRKGRTPP